MITFVLLSISVNAQWTQTSGPGGGIAKIIKVTPDGKFIVGSYGGIFLSADSGQTWVSSNTGIVKNAEIVDIDIVGSDIYIATSSSYFYNSYKSTNNGATWTEVFPSANFFVPFSITHIGNRVMISSVNEIKYSDDAGATWDTVSTYLLSPDSTGQPNISLVNVIDNVLWVGAWNMGLCKSIDSGATWVHADGGLDPTNPPAQIVSTGTALFVSIPYNQSVYTSTNNGATWTTVTFPNPAGNAAYVYNDNTDIYILSNPSIYKSTNNGSTWTTFSGSLIGYYIAMGNIGTSFLTSLNMYPTSLQRSVNSGATWVNANYGFASTRVESVLADGNNLYASSYETETYISSDSGNTYTQIPDGTFTYAIDMIKVGNEIVQGGYHFHYHTSNNGANWVSFSAGMPPTSTLSQYCLDGNDLYAATDAGLFKSVNFGTWTLVGASLPNANILNVNSVVKLGNRLFIAGDSASLATFEYFGVCYYSDDNGLTWTNFSAQFPFTAYTQGGKMFVVGNTIFMNAAAQVYSSTNNGLTWNLNWNRFTYICKYK